MGGRTGRRADPSGLSLGPTPDSPESFRLPEGFASVGDPVQGNPFPADDPRHRVWENATRTAELEVAQIYVGFDAARRQLRDDEKRTAREAGARIDLGAHFLVAAANIQDCIVSTVLAKFDAWAKRGVHVVWFDRDVELYDRWLVSFANGLIDLFPHDPPSGVPRAGVSQFLLDLRDGLGTRVRHWMAEARRYRVEQDARAAGSSLANRPKVPPTPDAASDEPNPPDVVNDGTGQSGGQIGEASESVTFHFAGQDLDTGQGRRRAIDAFLEECNRTQSYVIRRRHIWLAIGHTTARGFEDWQALRSKATGEVDRSIRRILTMPIPDFIDQLRRQGHLTDK